MRCINCEAFSFGFLCKQCKEILSQTRLNLRQIGDLKVYYFYEYSEIKPIIHSKHKFHGTFTIKSIANISFKKFAKDFKFDEILNAVPIDDKNTNGFSHTAILARALKSEFIRPIFGVLRAKSDLSYSGQSLKFRQTHPRKFEILKKPKYPIILVDDIITTGTTLLEAKKCFQEAGYEVAFALVLADARY
ncbi:MAG: ComF family protein [Campylobacter sp.]|nr:ComF family protein [Campylobacter sp.]